MNKDLEIFLKTIKNTELEPKNIELSHFSNLVFVSCYNHKSSNFAIESVSSGVDYNQDLAVLKSLVEFSERSLSKKFSNQFENIKIDRTDGFAAFPVFENRNTSLVNCRKNSFNEAFERYTWSKWWDDIKVGYNLHSVNDIQSRKLSDTLINTKNRFNLDQLQIISPNTSLNGKNQLIVILAKIKNEGYITGGAAGEILDYEKNILKALSELIRHLLSYEKIKNSPTLEKNNLTFYEQRLLNFSSGNNNKKVEERLGFNSQLKLNIPKLLFDNELVHPMSDKIILYRCLFENQPIFMGGDINRLCI